MHPIWKALEKCELFEFEIWEIWSIPPKHPSNLPSLVFEGCICRYDGIGRHSGLKIHLKRFSTGSSPVSGTIFSTDTRRLNALSVLFLLQNANNCIGRIDFGILVQMRVNIGGCSDGTVTKPRLNFLHGDTLGKQKRCTAMPLRYNYDKPEKPRISRVFGYLARFFILFQTEKSSREVVIS